MNTRTNCISNRLGARPKTMGIAARKPIPRSFALTLHCLVAIAGWTNASAASGDTLVAKPSFESITIAGPDDAKIDAEIGRIKVPENRRVENSNRIELAFIRVKSTSPVPRPPIFFLAGGPGGSSIASVKQMVARAYDKVSQYGDIVGIDQRGTGSSRPNLTRYFVFSIPLERPGEPQELLDLLLKNHRKVAESWREQGVDLTGYNTEESADDIDAVRRALGYDKIVLWGGSYGSHLAFATIRRHDECLEKVMVRSPEGPDHTLKLPEQIQAGLERVAELVAQDPQVGQHVPDLLSMTKSVLERLDREPVTVEITDPKTEKVMRVGVSKFDVQRGIANAIGRVRTMAPVPAVVYAMSQDDFTEIARQLVRYRAIQSVSAMSMMMDCASGISPERAARIEKTRDECLLGDAVNFPFMDICQAWGCPDLGAEFRGPLDSPVKILFMCGDLDSRTPVRNAREIMPGLPNSQLVVLENAGHDMPLFSSDQVMAVLDAFMNARPLPATRIHLPPPKFDPIE